MLSFSFSLTIIDPGNERKVQELAKPEIVNVADDRGGYTVAFYTHSITAKPIIINFSF